MEGWGITDGFCFDKNARNGMIYSDLNHCEETMETQTLLLLKAHDINGKTVPMLHLVGVQGGIGCLNSPEDGDTHLDTWAEKKGLIDKEAIKSFKIYIREAFKDGFKTMRTYEKIVRIQKTV